VNLVISKRRRMPKLVGRKLYYLLREDLKGFCLKLGRDKFFRVLRENGLLVSSWKRYALTTDSRHGLRLYENL